MPLRANCRKSQEEPGYEAMLVGWWVGGLVGWWVGGLVGWLVGWFAGWLMTEVHLTFKFD